jgi:hypothetical protein
MTLLDQTVITPISTQDDFTAVILQSPSKALVHCFNNHECASFPYKPTGHDLMMNGIEWKCLTRRGDAFWVKKPSHAKEGDTFEVLVTFDEQHHFLRFPYETLVPTLKYWYHYIPKHLSSKTYFTIIPMDGEERAQVLALRETPQETVPVSAF